MKRRENKGFTLVELVIVITIVAILAAVLVPTFIEIITNARKSSDMQNANTMNKQLLTFQYTDGMSASDIRSYLNIDSLLPANASNQSFWYDLANNRVLVCKGEELESSVQAQYSDKYLVLEEIIPGYILLDTGRTKIGEIIKGFKNLENADDYKTLVSELNKLNENYSTKLGVSKSQYSNILTHIAKFDTDKTIYVNDFIYITTAFKDNSDLIVDNIVFADNIRSIPSIKNIYGEYLLDNNDNNIKIAVYNSVVVPMSVKLISQDNIFNYIDAVENLDTRVEFLNKEIMTEGNPYDENNNLFTEYLLSTNSDINNFSIEGRAESVAKCTFELDSETIKLKVEEDGNTYSEISLKINIPQVQVEKDGIPVWHYNENEIVNKTMSEIESMSTTERDKYKEKLYNEGIKDERYKYVPKGNTTTALYVKIYDEYGILYDGYIEYTSKVKIDNFTFNAGVISFSTPLSDNDRLIVSENEELLYNIYINDEKITLKNSDYFTENPIADYTLQQLDNARECMIFLVKNGEYKICDTLGNYCKWEEDSYQWYNSEGNKISAIENIDIENIIDYYLENSKKYKGSSVNDYSKIYVEIEEGKEVLKEYFYRSVYEVNETFEGEYITNEIEETHESSTRYIYPKLMPLNYLNKNIDNDNGNTYYTMSAKIELTINNKITGEEKILCYDEKVFGNSENGIKTYYLDTSIIETETARYQYNYTYKNPLYYLLGESENKNIERIAFVDKNVITYNEISQDTYRFKVKGTGNNEGEGITILYGPITKPFKDYFDAEYEIKYYYDEDLDGVNVSITGLDDYRTLYNITDGDSNVYNNRITYKKGLDVSELDKSNIQCELIEFNGREAVYNNNKDRYEIVVFSDESFNPLTTLFAVKNGEMETICNAGIYEYTIEQTMEDDFDEIYNFSVNNQKNIKVYCKIKTIELQVEFLHQEINSQIILNKKEIKTGNNLTYNISNNETETIKCSYNEEINLSVDEDFVLDKKYSFVAWFVESEEYGKELISTSKNAKYNIPGYDIKIICEFATNSYNNDIFLFNYSMSDTCTITWCNDKTIDELYIPSYSGDYLVTGINSSVFKGATNLVKVYIPETVTSVDSTVFEGTPIYTQSDVVMFSGYFVKYKGILDENQEPIKIYRIPDGIKTIGVQAFMGNNDITDIYIPDSLKTIGNYAFDKMENLRYIHFSSKSKLTSIGAYCFRNCINFKGFVIDDDLTTVGSLPEGLKTLNKGVFQRCKSIEKINFKNVTTLGSGAFSYCVSLSQLDFTSSQIESIPSNCFEYCITISNINFGDNITSIELKAFLGCSGITSITIPSNIISYNIINCTSLTTVTILGDISEIPANAFYGCTSLSVIQDGNGESIDFTKIRLIGSNAFSDCRNYPFGDLIVGKINQSISIGASAFSGCYGLTSIKFLGDWTTKELPKEVFKNCINLKTADLNGATGLGTSFFYGCTELTNIYNCSISQINDNLFYNCTKLTSLPINDFSTYISIGLNAFYNCQKLNFGNIVLGNGESPIYLYDYAFYGTNGLTGVTINATILELRTKAGGTSYTNFCSCESLKYLTINADEMRVVSVGKTSTTIGVSIQNAENYLVYDCKALEKIELNVMKYNIYKLIPGIIGITAYVEDENTTKLLNNFGSECMSLNDVVIPYNTTILGKNDFYNTKVRNITKYYNEEKTEYFGNYGLTSIGENCLENSNYSGCIAYNSYLMNEEKTIIYSYLGTENDIILPNATTTIKQLSFANSMLINSIYSQGNLTDIQTDVFSNSLVKSFYISQNSTPNNTSTTAYRNVREDFEIIVPANLVNIYKKLAVYKNMNIKDTTEYELLITDGVLTGYNGSIDKIVLPDTVTKIASNVFNNCTTLTEITLNNKITEIGENAFKGCILLTKIEFPITLTSIGSNAFADTGITSINIPNNVTTIGENAFNTQTLTHVYIISSIPSTIGANAFGTDVIIYVPNAHVVRYRENWTQYSSNITYEGEPTYTLSGTKLTSYVSDETTVNLTSYDITEIYNNVFKNNTKIQSIIIPKTVSKIREGAFDGCTSLTMVTFVSVEGKTDVNCTLIGKNAFNNCSKLKTISNINFSKVSSFGEYAFNNCTSLDFGSITIKAMSKGLFNNCEKLSTLTIASLTSYTIPEEMCKNCINLTTFKLTSTTYTDIKIGAYAFYNCSRLSKATNLDLTKLNEKIGVSAFENCTVLSITTINMDSQYLNSSVFKNCINVKTVTITGTTATIPESIFSGCTGLTTVVLPAITSGDMSIGANVFNGCINLAYLYGEGGTKKAYYAYIYHSNYIGDNAFRNCDKLKYIVIKNSGSLVCTVGNYAFAEMDSLITLSLSTKAKFSGVNILQNCKSMTALTVTRITEFNPNGVYSGCTNLKTITTTASNIPNYAFKGASYVTDINAKKVTTIGDEAFNGCTSLENLYINFKVVTTIGENAFNNCYKLKFRDYTFDSSGDITSEKNELILGSKGKTITIGNTAFANSFMAEENKVEKITIKGTLIENLSGTTTTNKLPENIFLNGTAIKEVVLDTDNIVTNFGKNAFSGCYNLLSISGTGYDIEQITTFGDTVFSDCKKLVLTQSDTLTINASTIGSSVFPANYQLKTIVFTNITKVPKYLLSGWYNLESVKFTKTITYIYAYAFSECRNLVSILDANGNKIGLKNITNIGEYAFYNCKNLVLNDDGDGIVTIPTNASIGTKGYQFYNNYKLKNVTMNTTKATNVPKFMFYGCIHLEEISIKDNVKTISQSAFQDCINLKYIKNGDNYSTLSGILSLGESAFNNCMMLKFNENSEANFVNLTSIGSSVFANNISVKEIDIPNITTIGDNTFDYCANLKKVIVNSELNMIGNCAFRECNLLEGLYVANEKSTLSTVKFIGQQAFDYCYKLSNVLKLDSIEAQITQTDVIQDNELITIDVFTLGLGTYSFRNCKAITLVDFSDNTTMTTINNYAFYGCENLQQVKLSSNITSINDYAFSSCYNLKNVDLSGIKNIGNYAFQTCQSLTEITFCDELEIIGDYAFQNCVGLEKVKFNNIEQSKCKVIGKQSFYGCIRIRSIDLPKTLLTIKESAFERCTILYAINLGIDSTGKDLSIDIKAINNLVHTYFTFKNTTLTNYYKNYLPEYANKFYSITSYNTTAIQYGFVVVDNTLFAYDSEIYQGIESIKISKNSIEIKIDGGWNTIQVNIDNVKGYCFVYLNVEELTIVDRGIYLYENWQYKNELGI